MIKYIYHEQQDSQLCGQHCLNNLLQEPFYSAEDLAAIAQDLDQIEQSYITDTSDILASRREGDQSTCNIDNHEI